MATFCRVTCTDLSEMVAEVGVNARLVFMPRVDVPLVSSGDNTVAFPLEVTAQAKDGVLYDERGIEGVKLRAPDDVTYVYSVHTDSDYGRRKLPLFYVAVPLQAEAELKDLLAVPGPPSTFITKGEQGDPGAPGADSTVPGPTGADGGSDAATASWLATGPLTSGALTSKVSAPKIYHLDAYHNFFLDSTPFAQGQGNTATTLTSAVSATATVLPVVSGTSFVDGTLLVTNPGTATQEQHTVVSGGGTTSLTITPAVVHPLTSGTSVVPMWTNSTHLTNYGGADGFAAFAHWLANAQDSSGNYVINGTAPKVVVFGDSWIAQGGALYGAAIQARIPGATVVNAGVSGNTSAMMLARFDTDVPPQSPTIVIINEPGVNDDAGAVPAATQQANLELLVSKIRALGAVPVYTGHVPLSDYVGFTRQREAQTLAAIGNGAAFPAMPTSAAPDVSTPDADSIGIGMGALGRVTTGVQNTVLGVRAGDAITTGQGNTLAGREAGTGITTGYQNTGVGQNALRACVSGLNNTAVGQGALSAATASSGTAIGTSAALSVSTGVGNTMIGYAAGYQSGGDPATDATTTASYQTLVGYQAGSVAGSSYTTAVGYRAKASGYGSTALGPNTLASGWGSVAVGRDSAGAGATSTVQDQIALGTALHTVRVSGRLNVAPRTPTSSADTQGQVGDIATDDDYLYAKTSTGWKRAALTTW